MRPTGLLSLGFLLVLSAVAVAVADPVVDTHTHTQPTSSTYDVGFRVGGYGFKREHDTSATSWTECRMDGFGVFASRALRGPFFVEGGVDVYASQNFPTPANPSDLPIDRMSGLFSAAGGVRADVTSWLRGYLQVGAGVEVTRVAVVYAAQNTTIRDTKTMPEAFFGVGVDLKIARGTFVGASFRTLVMGNFEYDQQNLTKPSPWMAAPSAATVFDASPDLAAQGQFYVRRDL
ncbi:MAG: hypothetical protein NT062_13970 [Proteobacteria bacterium]|nr:hypothetical protein [Pseudomonadota bacterium]